MADEEAPRTTIISLPEKVNEGDDLSPRLRAYVTAIMYLAGYVKDRAEIGDVTEEELIEHIGLNIRRTVNPKFDAEKVS